MLNSINKMLDRLESRWALWLLLSGNAAVTGGGAYLAAFTDWMADWGPFGWFVAGLLCAVVFSTCLLLIGLFQEARSRRSFNLKRAEASTRINILNDAFEGEIIHVHDLWSFQHPLIRNKRFHKCRFVGPMVITFLDNGTVDGLYVKDCNFIEIGDSLLHGVIGFSRCILTECEYDCVTFLINEGMADKLRQESRGSFNFITRPKRKEQGE